MTQLIDKNPGQLVGQVVTLVGLAENAHQGAVVTLSDQSEVYVRGLLRWDKTLMRKQVKVHGKLRRDKLAPDPEVNAKGEVSHGMFGESLVIEEATWEALT